VGVLFILPAITQARSTKEAIIEVLSQKWPLTSKEIHNSLKRQHGFEGSYQAMHKTLGVLVGQKIALKEAKTYSLSKEWVKGLKNAALTLENSFQQNTAANYLGVLEKQGMASISLIGIPETATFLIHYFFLLPNPQKKPNIALWRNVYSIIGLNDTHYSGLKNTLSNWHAVSSENNPADRMFAEALKKFGLKVRLGVKEAATTLNDTFVCGDYVGTIWFPPEFREKWSRQNKAPSKINDFDLQHHLKMMIDEKAQINMIIAKNQTLADQIREKYMPMFEEEKK